MKRILGLAVLSFALAAFGTAPVYAGRAISQPQLLEQEVLDLQFMREEEKLARDSYLVLFAEWGNPIFENISESEQRHMDAIQALMLQFDVPDPVDNELVIGGYVNEELRELFAHLMEIGHESMTSALYVGALIEETDIEDIQVAIDRADNPDIISTYESLLCGSRNHLRSFVGQLALNGVVYEPEVIPAEVYDAIITSEMERDCGTTTDDVSRRGRSR